MIWFQNVYAMRKRLVSLIALPACVCLGSPTDATLPPNYAHLIAAVHEIIAASCVSQEAAIAKMKEERKRLGKKQVFSEISIDAKNLGEIRYHPTPFVTGHNVMTVADADGAYPGKLLLSKVQGFADGQSVWIQYSIRDVVSGEKIARHMYCEKFRHNMFCGSLPATYDVRAHIPPALVQ